MSGLVVPRRLQTWSFAVGAVLMALFLVGLAVFGAAEDGLPVQVMLAASAVLCLGFGFWSLVMGSFRLDGERVHSGWPRSRWIHRDEVQRIEFDGRPQTGGLVILQLVDGSAVKLVVVNPMFLLTKAEVARIERSIERLHRALGFD